MSQLLTIGRQLIVASRKGHSEEELRAMWQGVDLIKRAGEEAYIRTGMQLFREQKADTLSRLRDLYKLSPIARTSKDNFEIATKIFDLQRWYEETVTRYGPHVARSIVQGYRTGAERVGATTAFPPGDTRARATALEVLQKTKGINDVTLRRLAKQMGDGVENGDTVDQLAERVARVFGSSPSRSRTIAQTAATPVFENGQQLAFEDAGIEEKSWLSRRDGLVRDDHIEADGQTVKMDEPFLVGNESLMYPGDTAGSAGNVINCFVPETVVYSGCLKRAIRGRYDGELITIKTARGYELTGTPNHPILTPDGFITMGSLKEGMNIFSCIDRDLMAGAVGFDVDNMPATIEEVFNSLNVRNMVMRVPSVVVDLYGDVINGDVDIVNANGFLKDWLPAHSCHPFSKFNFTAPNLASSDLLHLSLLHGSLVKEFARHIADSFVCCLDKALSFLLARIGHAEIHRFASVSDLNPLLYQSSVNYLSTETVGFGKRLTGLTGQIAPGDFGGVDIVPSPSDNQSSGSKPLRNGFAISAERLCDLVGGFPVSVSPDNIVSIDRLSGFSGHVYTLETDTGIYTANGILASNCRCTSRAVL